MSDTTLENLVYVSTLSEDEKTAALAAVLDQHCLLTEEIAPHHQEYWGLCTYCAYTIVKVTLENGSYVDYPKMGEEIKYPCDTVRAIKGD